MLNFLSEIFEILSNIPAYILYVIESAWNLIMEGIQGLFELATSLIPLPEIPSAPPFIAQINWFFPIGAVVSIMVPIVIGYTAFLLIRWIYEKVGDL